jgi:hypothetical protein
MPRMNGFCDDVWPAGEAGDVEVRHELADIGEIGDALLFHGFRRERADRHWHVIDALLALLRSHDDGVEHRVVLFRFLSERGWRHTEREQRRSAHDERKILLVHFDYSLE